jgi:hypothetical protein
MSPVESPMIIRCSMLNEDGGAGAFGETRTPNLLTRRLCRACQQPGHLLPGLPGWLLLARVVFPWCGALYGQNQASSA